MLGVLTLLMSWIGFFFRSRAELEAEVLALRHQLNVLQRSVQRPPRLRRADRFLFVLLYRLCPGVVKSMLIVQPETVVRWHRRGFRLYWRWKSRPGPGRPKVPKEIRDLIREVSSANPLWGAPRIHGELLKLGIDVAQSTVAKYMVKDWRPPSQGWKTFLRNHADGIASMDFFVVPTVGFKLLFGFVVLRHDRRALVHFAVTAHPTAEWVAQQITEAFPWDTAPSILVRDRDAVYGACFKKRVRTMGIRDRPTAPRSPWQNGYAERLILSIRREMLDHLVIFNEAHLRRCLLDYKAYYNGFRTHVSLGKDTPSKRPVHRVGMTVRLPHLGGLHNCFVRT